ISVPVTRCVMVLSTGCCRTGLDWHIGNFILMWRLDRILPKSTIFEIYLNETWFGRGAYGVGAAARAHFGKSLSDLTIEEAAYIAGSARAPYLARNSEGGTERRNRIIDQMRDAGAVSPAQADSAKQQPLLLREPPAPI